MTIAFPSYLIPFKQWVLEEAWRQGVSRSTIYSRSARGKYEWLVRVRVNQRVIYVNFPAQ